MENKNFSWPGWETVRLIGQGSFGTVYEIRRQVFDDTEKAALKVISIPQNKSDIEELYSDGYDDESITSTFQSHLKSIVAEYSLTRKMNDCVNIVSCEDVRYVQHDDGIGWDIFIKMELLTPLTKALPPVIEESAAIKLALDMSNALEACRKHGVVHRDIKPQNIFVSDAGDYKLGDFGIAKTVEKTMGGTKIGTYKYMAPEVYNNQPYGCSADIYSLGMVLYWLLNERRLPFLPLPPEKLKAGMEENARHRRMAGEPLPPPAHGSELMKTIVLKACAFDPQQRYQTPAQMRKDLLAAEYEWKVQHPEASGLRICPACGSVLEGENRFCVFCGSPLTDDCRNAEEPSNEEPLIQEPTAEEWTAEEPPVEEPAEQPILEEPAAEEPVGEIVILDKWVVVPEKVAQQPEAEQPQTARCACCGAELVPGTRFCTQCGASLEQQPKENQEEVPPIPAEPEEQPVQEPVAEELAAAEPTTEELPAEAPAGETVILDKWVVVPEKVAQQPETEQPQTACCANCGAELIPGNKFCICCGARLEAPAVPQPPQDPVCGNCGAVLVPGTRFCVQCGTPITKQN